MHDALSYERARAALSHLDPSCEREVWVKYGICLKHEFGEAGFDIWDEWSSQCAEKYQASAARQTWKSIKAEGRRTIATLFADAKTKGWKDTSQVKKPTAAEIEARKAASAARAAKAAEEEAQSQAEAAKRAQSVWADAKPCETHPYLERKGVQPYGLRIGRWERIDPESGEVEVVSEHALLIPIQDRKRQVWSLQAIFPKKDSRKLYLSGGAKRGNFFPIGKPQKRDGRPVFLIGEGYATCASAHAATGHMVLVAFDVSNLIYVARQLREAAPDAWIVFLADNDTQTQGNPGVTGARVAALEVDGLVAVPPPGDFNDLQVAEGLEAVAGAIDAAWEPAPNPAPEPTPAQPAAEVAPPPVQAPDNSEAMHDNIDASAHFTVLGYDRGEYYVFIHEQRQISTFRAGEFSDATLITMAPLEWWEELFGDSKGGINKKLVMNWLFRLAHRRGIYDISRVRGRGAWVDNGRVVYHCGSKLFVDGQAVDVTAIRSKFVYELAKTETVPANDALTDADGQRLLGIAKMFRWSKPGAAALLAGWTFLAPVCGAIKWRPHVWLTGGAGSGKSTILKDFVSRLCGETKVFANGNSTEPGIRQKLKLDAIPVLFDEAEKNNDAEQRRIEAILALIRQASTESVAQTYKGTIGGDSMNFHIRSMFCLASIQAGLEHKADQDRLTKLALLKAQDDEAAGKTWAGIKNALYILERDTTLPARMLRRALDLLSVIQANIEVFVEVAAEKFGTQRMGDQYGTMLAGAWCLTNSTVATKDQAAAMINAYDWDEFTEAGEVDDHEKALHTLMEAKLSHKGEALSISTLVNLAAGNKIEGVGVDDRLAARLLRENGMAIKGKTLVFQNGSESLRKLVHGTKFESDLRAQLLRITGAVRTDGVVRFASGVARGVSIPLALVVDDEPPI